MIIELSGNLSKNMGKIVGFIPKDSPGDETCYRRTYPRLPTKVSGECIPPMDKYGPLCYKPCEQGFGKGPICFLPCPHESEPCGGLVCTKHGQTCSDYWSGLGIDAVSAAYSSIGTSYLSAIQSVMSAATNIIMPICPHMY
mmetsp:Transcript_9067/g.10678  ORF Transcript_9067/g.10678 Transcript_9067/m.10678 type:complete len:141 (+) Transcript_9067:572-994(+)